LKKVQIFYTKFDKELPSSKYLAYLNQLPLTFREKNQRFIRWQDRHANLFGKLLLIKALVENGYRETSLNDLEYTKYRRPYFKDDFNFNISHSGEYVVCAFSKQTTIGIDIEKISEIDFHDFERTMTSLQWQDIYLASEPYRSFFENWTMKESIIKADGRGLSIPLKEILERNNIVSYKGIDWYLNRFRIDDNYATCLATGSDNLEISLTYVNF
jgi:4'-phosphopantetheinyl transferase